MNLDVASGARACTETLDPTCLDNVRIALSAQCEAMSLVSCLRSLDWTDISESNRATLLRRNDHHNKVPTFFHYALQQLFTVRRKDRRLLPEKSVKQWEGDVAALRGSLNRFCGGNVDNKFLYVNFMAAMEAGRKETVRDALTYLAGAVASRPRPEYSTLYRGQ